MGILAPDVKLVCDGGGLAPGAAPGARGPGAGGGCADLRSRGGCRRSPSVELAEVNGGPAIVVRSAGGGGGRDHAASGRRGGGGDSPGQQPREARGSVTVVTTTSRSGGASSRPWGMNDILVYRRRLHRHDGRPRHRPAATRTPSSPSSTRPTCFNERLRQHQVAGWPGARRPPYSRDFVEPVGIRFIEGRAAAVEHRSSARWALADGRELRLRPPRLRHRQRHSSRWKGAFTYRRPSASPSRLPRPAPRAC